MPRTLIRLALSCLFVAALGGASQSKNAQTFPLSFYGTRPAIEVRVNGHGPFLFLVDTGAGGPYARADASLVARLSLPTEGEEETSDGGGATRSIKRVTLQSVEVGNFSAKNVAALSRDYGSPTWLTKIDGILGPHFFRDHLLTISFARGYLRIEDGELPPADGANIMDYELREGNIWIPMSIAGRAVTAVLDTGNIRALDVPSAALKSLRLASFPRPAGNSSGASGTTAIREVRLAGPLRIGKHVFPAQDVTFADDFQEVNVGSTLLQDFEVTIDQKNRRLRLVRIRTTKR